MIRTLLLATLLALWWAPSSEARRGQYLWQTNFEGTDVHIYRVDNLELHRRLEVGPEPHGIAAPKDGKVLCVSLEANGRENGELLWIDPLSLEIEHRLEVGPEPHAIATTPDGRYMYLSPMYEPQGVTVVDIHANHKVVGFIPFEASVRPSALSENGRLLFQHVDGLNGFQVAEVGQRRVMRTVEHSTELGWFMPAKRLGYLTLEGFKRCHGLALRPDQTEIWSVCAENLAVHRLAEPSFLEQDIVELEGKGYWLTFSPDSRYAFVALSDQNRIAVVDAASK